MQPIHPAVQALLHDGGGPSMVIDFALIEVSLAKQMNPDITYGILSHDLETGHRMLHLFTKTGPPEVFDVVPFVPKEKEVTPSN
jgi:hypothetical protein